MAISKNKEPVVYDMTPALPIGATIIARLWDYAHDSGMIGEYKIIGIEMWKMYYATPSYPVPIYKVRCMGGRAYFDIKNGHGAGISKHNTYKSASDIIEVLSYI